MSPALEFVLIATLAVFLAVASAAAGALWWRSRSHHAPDLDRLARELGQHGAALASLVAALAPPPPQSVSGATAPSRRPDPPEPAVPSGPVLIAVPDLAPPAPEAVEIPAELTRRFGAIWDLADSGAPTEAIARATGHPIGQVELILGLRRTRHAEARE